VTLFVAYLLVSGMGINGIWWGFPIGNALGLVVFMIFLRSGFWLRKWEGKETGSDTNFRKGKHLTHKSLK